MFVKQMKLFLVVITIFLMCAQIVNSQNTSHSEFDRIVEGTEAPEGKYPMMVSLQMMFPACDIRNGVHAFCGATILNDYTLLTAAHCVHWMKPSYISVFIGGTDYTNMSNCYWVSKIVLHPQFVRGRTFYTPDIAIIKLDRPILFDHLGSKLAKKSFLPDKNTLPVADECFIVGWGLNENRKQPKQLQEKKVTKINLLNDLERASNMLYEVPFPGGGCLGDSGGPLFCPVEGDKDGQSVQFGIASFIEVTLEGSCVGDAYYVNVALYIDWIREVAGDDE